MLCSMTDLRLSDMNCRGIRRTVCGTQSRIYAGESVAISQTFVALTASQNIFICELKLVFDLQL